MLINKRRPSKIYLLEDPVKQEKTSFYLTIGLMTGNRLVYYDLLCWTLKTSSAWPIPTFIGKV